MSPTTPLGIPNPSGGDGGAEAALARMLCDDFDARLLAEQVEAPLYDDSAQHVQAYWLTIAATALRNSDLSDREGRVVELEQALRAIRDDAESAIAYLEETDVESRFVTIAYYASEALK